MVAHISDQDRLGLIERVAMRIREATHGGIRDLAVEEVQGEVVIRGRVRTHHMRQLALHGALELLSPKNLRPIITVG